MYKYVKDTVFLKQMGRDCIGHLKSLRKIINNEKRLRVDFKLIGNDPLTMTIQDGINPLTIPFVLEILEILDNSLNESNIKEYIMSSFNKIEGSAFGSCVDSKYSIETKCIWYTTGNNTKFKLNISLVSMKNNIVYRLVKTKDGDSYYFEELENSKNIISKLSKIRNLSLYDKVRVTYLNKQNYYLKQEDLNYPSINLYINSIFEVYKKYVK